MEKHRIFRPRNLVIATWAIGTSALVCAQLLENEYGPADKLISHCNTEKSPGLGDEYQVTTAKRLLDIKDPEADPISFYGAACLTFLSREALLNGVELGPQQFGSGERVKYFDDCAAFAADRKVTQPDGLRRSQLVVACRGLHEALNG